MADNGVNFARALLGQGLGLGWGDEGEAWLRSKLAGEDYEQALNAINESYGQFSEEHPVYQTGSELLGAAVPGVAMMLLPGAEPAGAATLGGGLARFGAALSGPTARLIGGGAASGAVSGAGYAPEGGKADAALAGGAVGGVAGAALPLMMRGAGNVGSYARERFFPTEQVVEDRAAGKILGALKESGIQPVDLVTKMTDDKVMGVPSVLANVDPGLADLAEAVAQRSGKSARQVESALLAQKAGGRERAVQQVRKGMQSGDYYEDMKTLQDEMRARAKDAYGKAYADGVVTDPDVLKFLRLPQFQAAQKEAAKNLAIEGKKFNPNRLSVETLDNIKRGLDDLIEKETDAVTGKVTNRGRLLIESKSKYLAELDRVSPDYREARRIYAGDAEMQNAFRTGMNDWKNMDHEQVVRRVAEMSDGEKHAMRTGVARQLYAQVMNPSNNLNAAQRIIGAPEMRAKLQPMFDNPGEYRLFEAALKRESELYHQANRILGGSQTARRTQMREMLEGDNTGGVLADAVIGGPSNSLVNMVVTMFRGAKLPEHTADRLAKMLMSSDPADVAQVVHILEQKAARAAPEARRSGAKEGAALTGTVGMMWPSPQGHVPQDEAPE